MATHKCQQSNSKRPLPAYARPIKSASLSKRFNTYGASKKAVPLHKEEIEDDDLCCSFALPARSKLLYLATQCCIAPKVAVRRMGTSNSSFPWILY
ncbi:hypothetical protein PMIN02_011727 [Paraphaeosphaeria minitans]